MRMYFHRFIWPNIERHLNHFIFYLSFVHTLKSRSYFIPFYVSFSLIVLSILFIIFPFPPTYLLLLSTLCRVEPVNVKIKNKNKKTFSISTTNSTKGKVIHHFFVFFVFFFFTSSPFSSSQIKVKHKTET